MRALRDLQLLIESRYPIVAVEAFDEDRVEETLRRLTGRMGLPLFTWTVSQGLRRDDAEAAIYDTHEAGQALAAAASLENAGVFFFKDLERLIDEPPVLRGVLDLLKPFSRDRRALVLSGPSIRLPSELRRFAAFFDLGLPDRDALTRHLSSVMERLQQQHDVALKVGRDELANLVAPLVGLTLFEAERTLTEVALRDGALTPEAAAELTRLKAKRLSDDGLIQVVPIADAPMPAGLDNLVAWLERRQLAFAPGAAEFGLEAPRGLLLLGVQGCGKSMAARAVAGEWGVPLIALEIGSLYDKFIGETERRLERALRGIEQMAPCVVLIDEIEKSLSASDSQSDGGLSRRMLARLLGWLQDRPAGIFIVATCNSATALPPELMRKGRFDEIFFVDLPANHDRAAIFAAHLAARQRIASDFDLEALAAAADGFSGAEIEAVVVAALYAAFAAGTALTTAHLEAEISATVPLAVTRAEAVAELRAWARGRAVPAGRAQAA